MADKLNYVSKVYYNSFLQKYNPRVWFKLMSLNLDLLPYYDTKLLCKPGYYTSIQLNKSITDNEPINYNQVFIEATKHNDVIMMRYAVRQGVNLGRIIKDVFKIIKKNNYYLASKYIISLDCKFKNVFNPNGIVLNNIRIDDKPYWLYCNIFLKPKHERLTYLDQLIDNIDTLKLTFNMLSSDIVQNFIKYMLRDNFTNLLHYMLNKIIFQNNINYLLYYGNINIVLLYPDLVELAIQQSVAFKLGYTRLKLYQSIKDDNWNQFNTILKDNFDPLCLTEMAISNNIYDLDLEFQERCKHYLELNIDNIPYHVNIDKYITRLLELYPQLEIKSRSNNSFGWLHYLYQRDIFIPIYTDLNTEQLVQLFNLSKNSNNTNIKKYLTSKSCIFRMIEQGYTNSLISLIQHNIVSLDQFIEFIIPKNHKPYSYENHNSLIKMNIDMVEYLMQFKQIVDYCKDLFLHLAFKYSSFELVAKLLNLNAKISVEAGLTGLSINFNSQKLTYFHQVVQFPNTDLALRKIMQWAVNNNCKELFRFGQGYSSEIQSNINMNAMEQSYFLS